MVALLAVVSLGLHAILKKKPVYTNFPPAGGTTWAAFGDSLTSGYGASEGAAYPAVLGARLGIPIQNFGTPGATTQDALATIDEVLRADPKVVLLCFGGNDTLNSVPHEQTFRNLRALIDRLQQAGTFVVLIGIRSASVRDKYQSEFKRLAKEKKVFYIPNILSGVLGDPRLMSDYIHPNEQGYADIAGRIETMLQPLLPELIPGTK